MIPPHMVMILACSKQKRPVEESAAGDLYTGTIFKKGRTIAERHNIPFYILSARYGFLKPTTVIATYDTKFAKTFPGPFPPEPWHGFVLGGNLYFKNAPERFERLVPSLAIGHMLGALKALEDDAGAVDALIAAHVARYPQ